MRIAPRRFKANPSVRKLAKVAAVSHQTAYRFMEDVKVSQSDTPSNARTCATDDTNGTAGGKSVKALLREGRDQFVPIPES